MKVALSILACLLVANAAVLPQKGLGVTKSEIDTLIKDAVVSFRNRYKTMEPLILGINEIPIEIEGLHAKMVDTKVWIGETLKYSEWSSLSEEALDLYVQFVQKGAKAAAELHVTGTSHGKQVDQKGQIEVLLSTIGQINTLKAQLTPTSTTLVNVKTIPEIGNISVSVTGIEIEGVSKSDLESAIANGVKDLISKEKIISTDDLEELNKLIGKQSLQEIYDYFRKQVPSL